METKELKNIKKAISAWVKKHKGEVQFIGSFCAFKGKDCDVVDDLIIGFGPKGGIQIDLDELKGELKKEKDDFINW